MLSPTFKVRDFSITDIQPYPIRLQWQTFIEGEDGEMVVFKEGDSIYHSKMLSFYRKKPFDLVSTYQLPSLLPYPSPNIGTFSVKDVKPTEAGEASKIKVKVRMNIHGIFFVKSASLVEKLPVQPEEAMETDKPANATTGGSTDTSDVSQGSDEQPTPPAATPQTSEEGQDQPMEAAPEEQTDNPPADAAATDGTTLETQENSAKATPTDQQQKAPPTNGNEGAEPEKQAEKPPEAKKPKKPTVRQVDLPVMEQTASLTKKELDNMREKEVQLNYQDELEQQKIDAKNAVEEYVYEMRDKLSDSLAEYVTDKEKEEFSRELTATEDWLYDEGEDQPKKVYVKRLEELKKTGDKVVMREAEWRERPRAFEELASAIIHYEKILAEYKDEANETYRHIEEEEMKKVEEAVNTKRAWMNTKQHACDLSPKTANPTVKCSEIRAEKSNFESSCKPIVTKPKPKVEPPKDTEEKKEEGGEKKEGEGEGEGEGGSGGKGEGEPAEKGAEKMEEEGKEAEDMELD